MCKLLAQQIREEIVLLQRAETQAKRLLQTARAQHISFGFDYNYIDDDIAHTIGRLRYMELIAERHAEDSLEDK